MTSERRLSGITRFPYNSCNPTHYATTAREVATGGWQSTFRASSHMAILTINFAACVVVWSHLSARCVVCVDAIPHQTVDETRNAPLRGGGHSIGDRFDGVAQCSYQCLHSLSRKGLQLEEHGERFVRAIPVHRHDVVLDFARTATQRHAPRLWDRWQPTLNRWSGRKPMRLCWCGSAFPVAMLGWWPRVSNASTGCRSTRTRFKRSYAITSARSKASLRDHWGLQATNVPNADSSRCRVLSMAGLRGGTATGTLVSTQTC